MCQWQHTLTRNNQLWGCLNPLCLALFSAVDVVAKQSYVRQTIVSARDRIPKSNHCVGWDRTFANNFIITTTCMADFCVDIVQQIDFDEWWWMSGLRAVAMWSELHKTQYQTVYIFHGICCICLSLIWSCKRKKINLCYFVTSFCRKRVCHC